MADERKALVETPSPACPSRVLAIIVNWNKKDFVERLVPDIRALRRPPDEILVVDNASTDGSAEMIRRRFPEIRLVRNERNVGGSGGFNTGMRWGLERGGFDYFWLLDNDVAVHEGALSALLEVAESDPKVGMVGSRIAELGRPDRTQEVGARIYWPVCRLVKLGAEEKYPPLGEGAPTIFDADYVAACSLLARVAAIEEVGIWDPGYFVFFDDIEWGVRFNRAGWKVQATSASLVEHESFHERRLEQSLVSVQLSLRNALYFMHVFSPPLYRPFLLLRVFKYVLSDVAQQRLGGRRELARCQEIGIRDFFRSVRGKSEHTFADDSPVERGASRGACASKVPSGKGRILLWTVSGSDETRSVIDAFREAFPNHAVDVFVPAEVRELDRFECEGLVRLPTLTFWDRLALARWALGRYDAIAHHERLSRLLFEHMFPVAVWFSGKGEVGVTRNRKRNAAYLFCLRPVVWLGAAALAILALLKPRPPVDYFAWSRPSASRPTKNEALQAPDVC